MYKSIILFLCIFLVSSCSDPVEGKWDDNIKLSAKNFEFGAKVDSVIITTGGDWWWIDEISIDDSTFSYYNNENVNFKLDSYSIVENSFVIERRDKNTLFIKLEENITGKERVMRIGLQAGNYFDYVTIKQSEK